MNAPANITSAILRVAKASKGLPEIDVDLLNGRIERSMIDNMSESDIVSVILMEARPLIETNPVYSDFAANVLHHWASEQTSAHLNELLNMDATAQEETHSIFLRSITAGVQLGLYNCNPFELFDVLALSQVVEAAQDEYPINDYLGFQTLYDRYFLKYRDYLLEDYYTFYMRVAMGQAMNEHNGATKAAIDFFKVYMRKDYSSSTPTLFNSMLKNSQMSSCYLTTIPDDLAGIYDGIKDNALLSKFAGGLGNDWTPVRGLGSWIKGTNGKSQGVIPFLKVANDTAVAVNQCFASSAMVTTSAGPKPIKQIRPGDLVLTHSGKFRQVLEALKYNQPADDKVVKIKTRFGIALGDTVTAGHPFKVYVPAEGKGTRASTVWKEAKDLQEGDFIVIPVPKEKHSKKLTKIEFSVDAMPNPDFYGAQDEYVLKYLTKAFKAIGGNHVTDGYYFKAPYSELAVCLQQLLLCIGVPSTIRHFRKEGVSEQRVYFAPREKAVAIVGNSPDLKFIPAWKTFKGDILNKVLSVTETKSPKYVYDLKVEGDESYVVSLGLAHNGGKRKGAVCAYLETWHLDIEEFLELRKNTGDDRRRTHDMNTANWIPDLFMERLFTPDSTWTLFSPNDTLDLHDLYGRAFKQRYEEYEAMVAAGEFKGPYRQVRTIELWRKMLGMVFETGHPWITFKDPCNLRSPQQHVGVVHSSNLCVAPETLLMTKAGEVEIHTLAGQEVEFWNGEEWTIGPVAKTGENQKLLKVAVSNGKYLECTEYHKWYIHEESDISEVRTTELKVGDLLETGIAPDGSSLAGMTILYIIDEGRYSDTYCCTDPKRHKAMFNGIITGQCTEITLNTKAADEIAVCNLGSINIANHINATMPHGIDYIKLRKTVHTAVRMLDNVIDVNFYPVPAARNANMRHRPIGLGVMGLQDALYKLGFPYDSQEAIMFSDVFMEQLSYYAIEASADLAKEKGPYESFEGSLWSQGILPIDSIKILKESRDVECTMDEGKHSIGVSGLDWELLRTKVMIGMRNSNLMAIAPTATISNIFGVTQSIEPTYQNLYVKSNLSGEFTIINSHLFNALSELGLWNQEMVDYLKVNEGSVQQHPLVPDYIKAIFRTAFEVNPIAAIEAASRRQKWIDQAQSLNLYIMGANGKLLDMVYKKAWTSGLKTTYYLRALAATTTEKSTVTSGALNKVSA